VKILLLVLALVGLMIGSIYFPFPNGKSLDLPTFVLFWLRELIIVGVIVVGCFVAGFVEVWRHLKRRRGDQNAP
jgi:hypothetical protein